jgi:putative transposase
MKHGWTKQVIDWPYSSFHEHVDQGIYPLDWACFIDESKGYGE